jgi:hypothetical protein
VGNGDQGAGAAERRIHGRPALGKDAGGRRSAAGKTYSME